jgi:hypothetical protein
MNKVALPEVAGPAQEPEETGPPRRSLRPYAWGLLGAAGASAAVGAALGIVESSIHRDAVAVDRQKTMRSTVDNKRDSAAGYAIGAYVGLSVGGAALAASAILFLIDPRRGETHERQRYVIAPAVGAGGAGLAVTVSF